MKKIGIIILACWSMASIAMAERIDLGYGAHLDLPEPWKMIIQADDEEVLPVVGLFMDTNKKKGIKKTTDEATLRAFTHPRNADLAVAVFVIQDRQGQAIRKLVKEMEKASPAKFEEQRIWFHTSCQNNLQYMQAPQGIKLVRTTMEMGSINGNKALFLTHLLQNEYGTSESSYYMVPFKKQVALITKAAPVHLEQELIDDVQALIDSIRLPW